jgi:hypothetical protein
LVMAITSLLALVALMGQAALRRQAQFDEGINKVSAAAANARNQASAGIDFSGQGDGTTRCVPSSSPYVFAGTMLTMDNTLPGSPLKLSYYEADEPKQGLPGTNACELSTQDQIVGLGLAGMSGSLTNPASAQGAVLYVRTTDGALAICYVTNPSPANVEPSFAQGGCVAPAQPISTLAAGGGVPAATLGLRFTDGSGHAADLYVDQSGTVRRVN